jgi:sn-glycerol 3-phosphate transport system permease protein
MVLKVYFDGVVNVNIGSSAAQSVILMAGVIVLSALQFRFLGQKTVT